MESFFLNLVNLSIAASWLVPAVILLRFLLKKAPKWVSCLLWGIVGIRLVLPFFPESVLSLVPSAQTLDPQMLNRNYFYIDTGIHIVDSTVNQQLGDRYYEGVTVPANSAFNITRLAAIIWLVGMAAMLIYMLVSYLMLKKRVSTATLLRENIKECEFADSPFVLGLFKPTVYLPYNMDEKEREYVIAHETAHIKRRDYLVKPLAFLLLAVYWFNPLLWVAYILLCRDIELACDEKVIKSLGDDERKGYSAALLNLSVNRRQISACPLAFGEVGVKERVKSVLSYKKPAFWIILIAVIASAVTAVCFLTNPKTTTGLYNLDSYEPSINEYVSANITGEGKSVNLGEEAELKKLFGMLDKIQISENELRKSRANDRPRDYAVMLRSEKGGSTTYCFNADCSEVWRDGGIWPSYTHAVKNSEEVISQLKRLLESGQPVPAAIPYGDYEVSKVLYVNPAFNIRSPKNDKYRFSGEGFFERRGGSEEAEKSFQLVGRAEECSVTKEELLSVLQGGFAYDFKEIASSAVIKYRENDMPLFQLLFLTDTGDVILACGAYSEAFYGFVSVCLLSRSDKKLGGDNNDYFVFDASVLEVRENQLLVEPLEGESERRSADKIWVGAENTGLMKPGDKVRIVYDGEIAESYPAQIRKAYGVYNTDAYYW